MFASLCYQEVGRAGRDSEPAFGHLLYDPDDVSIQMDFIKWANPEPEFIYRVYRLLEKNPDRVKMEGIEFLRSELHFYHKRDFRLETSLNLLERYGCIEGTSSREWDVIEPPSGDLVNQDHYDVRLKQQQKNRSSRTKSARARQSFHRGAGRLALAGGAVYLGDCREKRSAAAGTGFSA